MNGSVARHFIEAQKIVTECCLFAVPGQACANRLIIFVFRVTTWQLGLDALRRFEHEALPMPGRPGSGEAPLLIAVPVELWCEK